MGGVCLVKKRSFKGCFCSKGAFAPSCHAELPLLSICSAFTLIELLVVVLIISILAAVAVPQYKKAVVKSKNAEMKQVVKAVADAERVYYLANGRYAANFNELDIDLPLTPVATTVGGVTGACDTTTQGTDASRQAKDYYVVLNNATSADMTQVSIVAYWRTGTYKCAGFGILPNTTDGQEKLHCREAKNTTYYSAGTGNFCEKLEQGTPLNTTNDTWRFYSLP